MFSIYDSSGQSVEFELMQDLKKYVENRHAEEGGFDWISEIKDNRGNYYGCTWTLEIEEI